MSKRKNHLFRNKNVKGKAAVIIGVAFLLVLVLGFVFGIYFFGMAGIFELLGVQYTSVWSLAGFVAGFFLLGVPVELFTKAIFKLSVRNLTGKMQVLSVRFLIEGGSNWLVLFTVDEFMKGMTLSIQTELIIAMLFAVLEITFDDKK